MTMKFLYAKPLGDNTCAIVVDMGNGYVVGGEVIITEFNNDYAPNTSLKDAAGYKGISRSRIRLEWAWSKGVKTSDMISGAETIFGNELKVVEAKNTVRKKGVPK